MVNKTQTSVVDLRLSRATIKQMSELRAQVKGLKGDVNRTKKAFQDLGVLSQRAQVAAALNTPGFQQGSRLQKSLSAQRTAFLGTTAGKTSAALNETASQQDRIIKGVKNERKIREALALDLRKQASLVSNINSLSQAGRQIKVAERRLAIEKRRGDVLAVANAQKLLRKLEQQQEVLRKNAQLSERQRGEVARRATRERLFGDGGASLFSVQAGLIANFAVIGGLQSALRGSVGFTIQLDEAMRNLQAIVRVTDTNLGSLKQSLIQISEETKFTAVEVANAGVTLGQAGFSVDEIKASIRSVTLLATATGTDLPRAVDIATSVLGVFGLQSSEMASVADVMTAAVNNSKLNIEKLALGLQFSGNIAAQSGLRFEELTSALGAMANAGIRSGSTLGTGMRQILISLQKPSGEFKSTLDRLGLSMQDVDIKSQGLAGVLMTLSEAGFTSSDAIRSFEVRAAAAFNALSGNIKTMLDLEASFVNTTAAVAANETQMRSLANQGRRLISVLGTVAAVGLDPMKEALIPLTSSISDFLSDLKEFEGILQAVTISVTLFGTAIAGLLLGRLIKYMALIAVGAETFAGAIGLTTTATVASTTATKFSIASIKAAIVAKWAFVTSLKASTVASFALTAAITALKAAVAFMLGPLGILLTLVSSAALAFTLFGNRTTEAANALEKAQTEFDRTAGQAEEVRKKISGVDDTIKELVNRQDSLRGSSDLMRNAIGRVQNQFTNMGRDASSVGTTVEELIESLQNLRTELAQEYKLTLDSEGAALDKLLEVGQRNLSSAIEKNQRIAATSPGVIPEDSVLVSNNPTGRGVSSELKRVTSRQAELQENASTQREREELANLTLRRRLLEEISRLQSNIYKTKQEMEKNTRTSRFADDLLDPVIGNAMASANVRATRVQTTAANPLSQEDLTSRERVEMIEAARIAFETEMALFRSAAAAAGAGEQSLKEIDDRLANGLGEFSRAADAAAENFNQVLQGLGEIEIEDLQREITSASTALSEASSDEKVSDAFGKKVSALRALAQKEMEHIKRDVELPELREAQLESRQGQLERDVVEALAEASARIAELGKEAREKGRAIAESNRDNRLALLESEKQSLLNQLDEAKGIDDISTLQQQILEVQEDISKELRDRDAAVQDLSDGERAAQKNALTIKLLEAAEEIRKRVTDNSERIAEKNAEEKEFASNIIRQMKEQARLQRLILFFGEDSVEVARERARVEREAFAEMVKTRVESEELQKAILRVYDAGKRFSNLDLGRGIRQALGSARSLLGVMSSVGARMGELAFDQKILDIEGDTIGNPEERARQVEIAQQTRLAGPGPLSPVREALIEQLGDKAAENERKRIAVFEAERLASDTGGGGGGNEETDAERRAEAMRRLLARVENAGNVAEIGIENGSMSSGQGVRIMEGVLGESREALAERESLISQISQNVNRTAEEEERLTTLLEEHQALNTSIEAQEKRISSEKGRQGILQLDLNRSVKEWAKANLDLNATMESGLANTLSSMTRGFSELFQKLSTEPKKAGQAMLGFARTVAEAMQKAIAEMMAVYVMQKLIGMAFPGAGAGDGSFGGTLKKMVGMRGGGEVQGGLNRDSEPHLLMPGEFVLRRSAAQALGIKNLERINAMGNRRMATGGHVGAGKSLGKSQPQNLWLVDERSRAPVPGTNDIIAVISDDMSRGGQTKQLIRAISSGEM